MLEIVYAIPSCNIDRCRRTFDLWKRQGYKTAVLMNGETKAPENADLMVEVEKYGGYYQSFNTLYTKLPDADIIITGGDDIHPDMKYKAQELGEQFFQRFPAGFGVMQPIGDNMKGNETICASPWIGKGWLKRAYRGKFPFWPEYIGFFGDQELKEIVEQLKILWLRKDIKQYHNHWSRPGGPPKTEYQNANDRHWDADKALFYKRKAAGWPEYEPLPA